MQGTEYLACTRRETSVVQLRERQGWKESTDLGITKQGLVIQRRKKTEKSQATISHYSEKVSNVIGDSSESSNPSTAISSSNIGFQLLKKHGWKEGTGLGITEQGILVPLQAEPKHNKQGLGAEKPAKRKPAQPQDTAFEEVSKKSKKLSKKLVKMIEHEKRLAENEFERAFRREFWPDNV
ncbi:putative G patch domain and ankyrin repeat-containing protein [Arabidopsis thaliana]|uniref:G-patch domain-containing protein n=1 Tax=Arabidopsis thaliana TaxID=3702 RepID=A0A5S9XK66_ARATH|nr:unnamed protein product [Arabidopsis thaliana]